MAHVRLRNHLSNVVRIASCCVYSLADLGNVLKIASIGFPVPHMRDPFSLQWFTKWSLVQWLQYSAGLNMFLLLLPLPDWVCIVGCRVYLAGG
jgi:hypothetical protein